MQNFSLKLALVSLVTASATPAIAAEDMGMRYGPGLERTTPRGGVGAQASVRIKLGDERVVKDSARVALGVAAGPVITVQDARTPGGTRRSIAGVASFSLQPGHATVLKLAGRPVIASYAERGAAGVPTERKNMSTAGKIGIGVGVLLLVGVVAVYAAVHSDNWDD